ncbi:DUF4175 family protein [Pontibacter arcticus]|uniref:DUF4175 domain-containing protein n=1 Tax=Pontibacter arcticus TaxID=2080288 RepID=A0A364RJ69_9BACT|nr:DUF4175 family protein [Pontibacter arcticus]RAU84349.1 hypothetical protein DP923_04740 [Pontibacter arcticus]
METEKSISILEQVRRQYVQAKMRLYAMQALALLLVGVAILYRFQFENWLLVGVAAGLILLAFLYFIFRWQHSNKTTLQQVASHLNRNYPQLEDSSALLLRPATELNLLEKLQQRKVATALQKLHPEQEKVFYVKPATSGILLAAGTLLALLIVLLPAAAVTTATQPSEEVKIDFPNAPVAASDTIVKIEKIDITVTPPSYTGKAAYTVSQPNLRVEQGATITWRIHTNKPAKQLQLVLNENTISPFKRQQEVYTLSKAFTEPALYNLRLNGENSAFYTLEIIPDEAPTIVIQKPEQYTEILFGDPQRVNLQATISDDYGIREANLVATVAKGTGEAVKFREEKISLGFSGTKRSFHANQTLDLKKLGMTYGDELYFYIQAHDNHRGYTRSETYFVQIEDTAVVDNNFDMSMGVNPVPEYFRSQRQIIIDTEKLIAEQKNISRTTFEQRSNNIGADQKLLRLRYGKFLGEESESGIGPGGGIPAGEEHSAGDGHDHPEFENSNDPQALLDPYMHKHDQEGEATIFEPAVKAKLKGALAQMWEAELRLRTHKPKEALPFEYKALRLLKQVQQSSRAYVAKTGFDAPPLKEPEKRLTGDLSKITAPSEKQSIKSETNLPHTRAALNWLENYKHKNTYVAADSRILEKAGQEMAQQAFAKPGRYLQALQDLRTLISDINQNKPLCRNCLVKVESAWAELLPPASQTPQKANTARGKLGYEYLKELQKRAD